MKKYILEVDHHALARCIDVLTEDLEYEPAGWENFSYVNQWMTSEFCGLGVSTSEIDVIDTVSFHPNVLAKILTQFVNAPESWPNSKLRLLSAWNTETPPNVLEQLSMDDDWDYLREAVANNPSAPFNVLKRLTKDKSPRVAITAQSNSSGFEKELVKIANEKNPTTNLILAKGSQTSSEVLLNISKEIIDGVRQSRESSNPNASSHSKQRHPQLTPEDLEVLHQISQNRNLNSATTEYLVELCEELGELNSSLSVIETAVYAISPHLARNESLDKRFLEQLSMSKNKAVRKAVAQNSSTSSELMTKLAMDNSKDGAMVALASSKLEPDFLHTFAGDRNTSIRATVAHNPNTSKSDLILLAKDSQAIVRMAVADNETTPENVLETLASDKNSKVRTLVAWHKNLLDNTLTRLAADKQEIVRFAARQNEIGRT